jgi:hypothetical protein
MAKNKEKASAAGPKAQQKLAAEEREKQGAKHTAHEASRFLKGQRIDPRLRSLDDACQVPHRHVDRRCAVDAVQLHAA